MVPPLLSTAFMLTISLLAWSTSLEQCLVATLSRFVIKLATCLRTRLNYCTARGMFKTTLERWIGRIATAVAGMTKSCWVSIVSGTLTERFLFSMIAVSGPETSVTSLVSVSLVLMLLFMAPTSISRFLIVGLLRIVISRGTIRLHPAAPRFRGVLIRFLTRLTMAR